ncbi:copper homeostasis protein CutC [Tahibacter aquaticus]|nr:copper homeostasis protein CutC [Tahibacter aquaticus]
MPELPVEICIDCGDADSLAADCAAAAAGGAATIELCRDMAQQGLTPHSADLRIARQHFPRAGLFPMIRPRAGDFFYSAAEIDTMLEQIALAAEHGADGVVFGALRGDKLDTTALARLFGAARARGLRTMFHRAFDALDDGAAALETLIGLGADRIMSSGMPWGSGGTALDGAATLARLIDQAGQRVEIVLGGGIGAHLLRRLLPQLPPGRVAVHAYSAVLTHRRVDAAKVRELGQAGAA